MKTRDRVAFVSMMVVRLGFVAALILGLGMLTGVIVAGGMVLVHILAGVLVIVGIWATALRFSRLGRSPMALLWAAAGLAALGAALGLSSRQGIMGGGYGVLHLVIMLAAVALAEIGAGRINRGER